MILRLSAVSASAAWPQITGIKSRASHHYQPSNYQPSKCTTRLPTTATNLPTVLSAYQQCTPFHISPPRTQTDQFVGNALSDSNEGLSKQFKGTMMRYVMQEKNFVRLAVVVTKRQSKIRHLFQANDSCKPVIS